MNTTRNIAVALLLSLVLLQCVMILTPCVEAPESRKIKLCKHIVTENLDEAERNKLKQDLENWVKKANEVWNCSLVFEDGAPDEVDEICDGWVDCCVNIYGVSKEWSERDPDEDNWYNGLCRDQMLIEVAQDAKVDSLAHELGHFFCLPESQNDNTIPTEAEKKDNIMWSGCQRASSKNTEDQQNRVRKKADTWLQPKVGEKDPVEDVSYGFIDLNFDRIIAEYTTIHFTLTVASYSAESCRLGFYMETDGNPSTGAPPNGLDFFIGFNPALNQIIYERYDTSWTPQPISGITYRHAYHYIDSKQPSGPPPSIIGVSIDLPMPMISRRGGSYISFKAVGEYGATTDASPDVGLKSITYPPSPPSCVGGNMILMGDHTLSAPHIAPYIGLASTILVATVATAIYVKRLKRPKKQQ